MSKIKNREKITPWGFADRHTDGQKIATPYNEKLEETERKERKRQKKGRNKL